MPWYDETIQRFQAATRIPVQLFRGPDLTRTFGEAVFHPNPASHILTCVGPEVAICRMTTDEFLTSGLVRQNGDTWVLGPVRSFEPTAAQATSLLNQLNEPSHRHGEFWEWLRALPVYEVALFVEVLRFLVYLLGGGPCEPLVVEPRPLAPLPRVKADAYGEHFDDQLERNMLSCIEFGKPDDLALMLEALAAGTGGIPRVATDAVRAGRNIFIHSLGAVSRAAYRGGLDYDTMTKTCNLYLGQIESLSGSSSMSLLFQTMLLDFARLTQEARSLPSSTATVATVSRYVSGHLAETIGANDLAQAAGLTVPALSRHFKRHTGMTLTDYIRQRKLEEACRLLDSTDLPVARIAERVGFRSQSYFQVVFRQVFGMTPGERRSNRS